MRPKINWKTIGGHKAIKKRDGYWYDQKHRPLHRLIYKDYYDEIPSTWEVHHVDFNPSNNDISNLIAMPKDFHRRLHKVMDWKLIRLNKNECLHLLKEYCDQVDIFEKYFKVKLPYTQVRDYIIFDLGLNVPREHLKKIQMDIESHHSNRFNNLTIPRQLTHFQN